MGKTQKILIAVLVFILLIVYLMNSVRVRVSSTIMPQINAFEQTIALPIEVVSILPFAVPIKFSELKVVKTDGTVLIESTASTNRLLDYRISTGTTNLLIPFKVASLNMNNIPLSQWLFGIDLRIQGTVEVTVLFTFRIRLNQPIKL